MENLSIHVNVVRSTDHFDRYIGHLVNGTAAVGPAGTITCKGCLPGGGLVAGETAEEACEREVFEETRLHVRVTRLVGVYSYPDQLVVYADGNKAHIVALQFEVR